MKKTQTDHRALKENKQPRPSKSEQTRARVIQAAIDCIYEQGFHDAHTNRIAERAGVSWGVLQYHFGDKDGLLKAVLEHTFQLFTDMLAEASVQQGSLKQRVHTIIDELWLLVSRPEYRVNIAILRNIGRSPDSDIDEQLLIKLWSNEIAQSWDALFKDLLTNPRQSEIARRLLFAAMRGFADELNPNNTRSAKKRQQEFDALADAITFLLCQ